MSDPFVAEMRIFPFNFPPKGWAFCDGQLLPLSQNTALFSLLGTTYGGDGKSTFGLPDMQGRAPMQQGDLTSFATNTGALSRTLSQPRLATACWLTVLTVMPFTMPNVTRLDTSSWPNWVPAA